MFNCGIFWEVLLYTLEMNLQNVYTLSLIFVLMYDEECLYDKKAYRSVLAFTVFWFMVNFFFDIILNVLLIFDIGIDY